MAIIGGGSSIGGLTGSGSVSRLLVVVSGETSGLERSMAGATGSLTAFQSKAGQIGGALTRSLTLPLLALGGVSLKLASDYASAIGRVQGLTTVLDDGKHSIEEVSNSLLKLSQKVPTAPTELADALYFAGSAGLNFSTAMQVVTASAKGAAIGMGDAKDIAKVLIFALNAFQGTGLTAAHAMDVLTASIKLGTAEPDEMAIALGRLLPIARDAGLTFDDVAASVAALTNIGLPTRVATTSLRALFTELLAPTEKATETLNNFGISAQRLRDTLSTGGPIAAFKLLEDATRGNVDALHDIIPQIRGFTAFTGLSGEAMKTYRETIKGVHESVGALNDAFKVISKTPAFQFEIAINKLRVAGIKMGNLLIPIFLTITDAVGAFADQLSNLSPTMSKIVVTSGLLLAVLGPLLKIYGTIASFGGGVVATTKSIATAIGVAGIAAGIAYGGFQSLSKGSDTLMSSLSVLIGTAVAAGLALKGLSMLAGTTAAAEVISRIAQVAPMAAAGLRNIWIGLQNLSGVQIAAFAGSIALIFYAIGKARGAAHEFEDGVKQASGALLDGATAGDTMADALGNISDSGAAQALRDVAKAASALNKPVGNALPQTIAAGNRQLDVMLAGLVSLTRFQERGGTNIFGESTGMDPNPWIHKGIKAIQLYRKGGIGLAQAFDKMGVSEHDFVREIKASDEPLGQSFDSLVTGLEAAGGSQNKYTKSLDKSLKASAANDVAVNRLARHYGVSADFIKQQLGSAQVSATDVANAGKRGIDAFGNAMFGASGKAGRLIAREMELAQITDKLATSLADAETGSLDLFGKMPKAIKKSTDTIVTGFTNMSQAALHQAEDIQTLIARGVPSDLIEKMIGQGPEIVKRFADATTPQLKKVLTAYQIYLGATDKEILKEGLHQKKKGSDMVQGFVISMLSRQGILSGAGHKIVNFVTGAILTGNMKPSSLKLINNFADAIESSGVPKAAAGNLIFKFASGLAANAPQLAAKGTALVQRVAAGIRASGATQKAGGAAMQKFASELLKNHGELPAGSKAINKFASGIAAASGAPVTEANRIASAVREALRAAQDGAYATGAAVGEAFARGITSGAQAAINAARQMANEARAALNAASYGSPKRFSYYIGEDIGKQFHEGMAKGHGKSFDKNQFRSFGKMISPRHGVSRRSSGRMVILEGNIQVDGMDSRMRIVAREEAIGELSYRGM